ncbi:MAG: flagellar biosynthetic protein FliR [Oscillospiraceae bacterium]|nr:flagellar biosynthetic protein FliR [Oscillospiraceae bacterium]
MQEIWDLILYNFVGILIVFARIMGVFIFNPILGRNTVPMRVRVAMTIVLTMAMLSYLSGGSDVVGYIPGSAVGFAGTLIFEGLLGFVFGFIVNMILSVLLLGGKIIDNQMTLALAETMNPAMGATMGISANLYYNMFILYFFLIGGHLSYINLFALSYDIIPIGHFGLGLAWRTTFENLTYFLTTIFTLAVKMAMPIIAAEMILQMCVGVIMKAVPSIQIFVINIQLKLFMGFFMILAIAAPMSDFLQKLLDIMFANLYGVLSSFG